MAMLVTREELVIEFEEALIPSVQCSLIGSSTSCNLVEEEVVVEEEE
jgi:hypothetical protein